MSPPQTPRAEHPLSSVLGALAKLAAFALALGIPWAALSTWLELAPYASTRDVWRATVASEVERGLAGGFVLAIAGWLVLRLLRGSLGLARAAAVAVALTVGVPGVLLLARANHVLLPELLSLPSLAGNALGLAAVALLGFVLWRRVLLLARPGTLPAGGRTPWLALCGLLPLGAHLLGHQPAREDAPDVIVIVVDVLRADHVGCYGYERDTTPHIDRFAEDAVLFENAISPSTFTKTSVASLFTGLYPHHHAVYEGTALHRGRQGRVESDTLSARHETVAEALFDHGLQTVAWVQNAQLRAYMGFAQGFARYYDQPGGVARIAPLFADWLDRWREYGRTFAYLHVLDLHAPYNPEPPFAGRFGSRPGAFPELEFLGWNDLLRRVHTTPAGLSPEELFQVEARHDEMLAFTDEWIGRILDDLRERGTYDDSLIVITSDHGEGFWEHEFLDHSKAPFEELCRVPLIVKLPESEHAGSRVPGIVSLVDLAPTLLEFAGASVPPGLDGQSFLGLLRDPSAAHDGRPRVIEYKGIVGIRTDRWKYLKAPDRAPELFDLEADPGELVNVIDRHPDVAARMQEEVDRARRARATTERSERVVVDEETQRNLEALGYM